MESVIYSRVSTEEQAKDVRTSLRFQQEQCREYCQRMGYDVLEEVTDPGHSGLSLETPGLLRIKQLAATRVFVLVAWSSDRLARDVIRRRLLVDMLKKGGGRIEYATEKYEDSDTGEAIQDILQAIHWLHARKNRENVWRGQYQTAKEGHYMPRYVRLGYDWTEVYQDGPKAGRKVPGAQLVVNPQEAQVVRFIFDLYEQMSMKKVAICLNEQGYRLPCKSPKWSAKYGDRTERLFRDLDINTILKDELYTGTVTWGKTTKLTGKTPQPISRHDPELQIISFEQFNRIQRLIRERSVIPPKSVSSPYVFSGLLRCPKCGGRTVACMDPNHSYTEKQRSYNCSNYHRYGTTVCKGWAIYEQTVRKAIVSFLAELFTERLPINEYLQEEAQAMAQEGSRDKADNARETIQQGKMELKRIQELAVKGIIQADEASEFVRDAREKIERAEGHIKSLETQAHVKGDLAQALDLLNQDLTSIMDHLGDDALRKMCRQVFRAVTVKAWGRGRNRKSAVTAWEFTPELQGLLAEGVTHSPEMASRWEVPVDLKSSVTSDGSRPLSPRRRAWEREAWGSGSARSIPRETSPLRS